MERFDPKALSSLSPDRDQSRAFDSSAGTCLSVGCTDGKMSWPPGSPSWSSSDHRQANESLIRTMIGRRAFWTRAAAPDVFRSWRSVLYLDFRGGGGGGARVSEAFPSPFLILSPKTVIKKNVFICDLISYTSYIFWAHTYGQSSSDLCYCCSIFWTFKIQLHTKIVHLHNWMSHRPRCLKIKKKNCLLTPVNENYSRTKECAFAVASFKVISACCVPEFLASAPW